METTVLDLFSALILFVQELNHTNSFSSLYFGASCVGNSPKIIVNIVNALYSEVSLIVRKIWWNSSVSGIERQAKHFKTDSSWLSRPDTILGL